MDGKGPDKKIEWDNTLSQLQAAQTASANGYVAEAERLINIAKTKSGLQLIELLKDAGDRLQKAIACHAIVLEKTKVIGNEAYRQSLAEFRSGIVKTIENYQAEIRHLEHQIGFLEAIEKAKLIMSACEEKKNQAASYVSQYSFPHHLKEIETSIHYFNEAAKLYREVEEGYINAISLFNPYSTPDALENKRFFSKQATDCRDLAANCKKQAEEWPVRKQSQIRALMEQLTLLKGGENGTHAQKQMIAILQELVDVDAADENELFALEKQLALSQQQNTQGEPRPFPEDFYKKEQTRKEHFYLHLPSVPDKSNQLTFLIDRLFKPGPFAIPLDGQYLLEGRYAHYLGQFYRVLVGVPPPTDFKVKVYEDGNAIHEEIISLPKKGSPAWDTYLIEDGNVYIPKTELSKSYGLDLRVKILSEFEFVLAIKGDSPYQFSICLENQPIYAFGLNAPPPWQLEVLKKPGLPTFKPRPFSQSPPTCAPPQGSLRLEKGDELIPHPLLNQLVVELKKDPLAIAQYVQNEIDLADPFIFRTQDKVFEAPLLHRSALGTFLEGEGSAWEQCALLIYLLEEAGFKATYAQTCCTFPVDYIERLLFTKLPGEKEVVLNYPFVLLELDQDKWVSLFPWMKNVQVAEGHDLYSLMPDAYSSANKWIQRYLTGDEEISKHIGLDKDDTVGVLYSRFASEQLQRQGLSIQDVGCHRTLIKQQFTSWEEFPRPEFENYNVFESLPPQLYATLDIEIASRENPGKRSKKQVSLPFLNGRFFALDFKGDDHYQLMSFYLMDGWNNEKITSSTAQKQTNIDHLLDQNDLSLDIQLSYQQKGVKWTRNFSVAKGTKAALCFSFGNTSPKTTSLFARPCLNKNEAEENLHSLLAFTGALYFEKCNRAQTQLAILHKLANPYYFGVGLAKLTSGNSIKTADTEMEIKFPQVDMAFYIHCNIDSFLTVDESYHLRLADYLILTCADYSSNEHQVIQDVFKDQNAISTIKLLKIAHKGHQEKGREGLGFLALTERTHSVAEKDPFVSKFLNFPHLPDFSFERIFTQGRQQWITAGRSLAADDHAIAFMTPVPTSNAIDPTTNSASYTGFGTLIFNSHETLAMISDSMGDTNGGYGSGLLLKDLNAFDRVKWNLYSTKVNHEVIADWLNKPTSLIEHQGQNLQPKMTPTMWVTKWASDVRQLFKTSLNTVADPVDIVTGAFYIDEVDLTIPGPFPLEIRRNYSNQNSTCTFLGPRWKLSLNPYLHEEEDKLYAAEEDGSVIVYRRDESSARWRVFPEDNPELYNSNQKGIGSVANPFHAYIVEDQRSHLLFGSDGSKRRFENHLLKEWINPAGHTLIFSYVGEQLKEIESSNGSYIGFCYDFEGKLTEAYSKDSRRIYYLYNSLGDLCKVILPNGAEIEYVYDTFHQIIQEIRPNGKVLKNTYDDNGRVIEQQSPTGPQQEMVISATFSYSDETTIATDASGASTEYKIFGKQIYKITDPQGYITLQSWFINANSYFDPEKGCVVPFEQIGGYGRSLRSTQDKRGLVTEYSYDSNGNPIEISLIGEDLTGLGDQKLTKYFSYNEFNLPVEEKALNKITKTLYDDQLPFLPKRIETFIDQTSLAFVEFKYTNGLLQEENRSGAVTRWTYDKRGFPIEIAQETGMDNRQVVTKYSYNDQGRCVEKRTQSGIERSIFDNMGNRLQRSILDLEENVLSTITTGYNLDNHLAWQQGPDPQNTLMLDYNANGQLKASMQSLTLIDGKSVVPAGLAYSLYNYDTRGHLIEEVNPIGVSTYREYDELGRLSKETIDDLTTEFSYEAGGMVATITAPNGGQTTRLYTTNGLLKKEIYPDGTESSFAYDFFGRPIMQSKNGMTLEITYDDALSTVTRTQRESGITEVSSYDSRGNLIRSTDAEGYIWEKSYDLLNRILTETDPEGNTTTWSYGEDTVSYTLPSGETTIQRFVAGQLVETKTINAQGDLLLHKLIHYYPESSKVEEISGNFVTTTQTNTLGQPLLVQKDELCTSYQYDHAGRCIASIDGEGKTTQREFDKLGRTAKQILPDGTPITFTYDEGSNLIAYHLPDNLTWQATYDLMSRKTSEALHANGQITQNYEYTYENGLLQQVKDPLGRVHHYTYDSALRLVADQVEQMSHTFTYDQRGLLTSTEQTGPDHALIKRDYNPSGNLTSEAIYLNGELLQQTNQTWTPSSRSLQIGDHHRDFQYKAGQLKTLSSSGLELSYEYALNSALNKKKTPFYSTDFTYNSSSLAETRKTVLGSNTFQESLQWTPSGRLASYRSNNSEKRFSYTPRGCLKSAGQDRYEFDFGKQGRGVRTSAPEHVILSSGLDPFGKILQETLQGKTCSTIYDAIGQTLSRTTKDGKEQFEWDAWGNLIAISSPGYTWKASYDALGRRLQTTFTKKGLLWNTTAKTTSLFDPEHEFQEIGVKLNDKTFWKLYGPTSCDAIVDSQGNAITLFHDGLGNLKALISQDNLHWIEELPSSYGPTGPPISIQPDLLSFARSHSWQGNRQDPSGLIHLGARYYDPKIGRFLSPDPIGYPIPLDLYSYANGDPVNFRDPSGRFSSASYLTIKETVLDTWNSPRFNGALQVGFGLSQAVGGAAYTAYTGGVGGLAGGGFMFFRGLDDIYTGARQVIANEWRDSAKSQLLQDCGVPRNYAEGIDTVLGFGSPKNASRIGSSIVGGLLEKCEEVVQYTKSNLRLGQQVHESYKIGEIILGKKTKEFILPSRRRIDFLDRVNGKVYELKPNNPRAIREGQKQLQKYIEELKTIPDFEGINWEGILETY